MAEENKSSQSSPPGQVSSEGPAPRPVPLKRFASDAALSQPPPRPVPLKRYASAPDLSKEKEPQSPAVSLSQTDVDPELLKLQIEWADLLMNDNLVIDIPPKCDLSPDKKQLLAGRWFDDGVVGWKIDYPQTEFELKCYRISRSRRFLQIYTIIFFMHMCSPFLGEPYCAWEFYKDNEKVDILNTGDGHFLPRLAVNLFDLFCILVYLFDIVLRLVVNNGENRVKRLPPYKDKWILIRLVCASLLLVDVVSFLITRQPLRYARALIPVIYIARRNSMRQMVHGLMLSFGKSTGILSFLVLVHLFWSYLGFVIFRGVDLPDGDRFYDFPTTMMTVLQCVASRSFSILALSPYYEVNPTASLFFLALTIAADLVCINLIVAVGNRQYKLFSQTLYKRQLRNRRQAFVAIHSLLADDRGFISRETWLGFCSHIQGKYSVKRQAADLLFSLECEKDNDQAGFDCVDTVGFFRLSGLLSARIDIDVTKVVPATPTGETTSAPWGTGEDGSEADGGPLTESNVLSRRDIEEDENKDAVNPIHENSQPFSGGGNEKKKKGLASLFGTIEGSTDENDDEDTSEVVVSDNTADNTVNDTATNTSGSAAGSGPIVSDDSGRHMRSNSEPSLAGLNDKPLSVDTSDVSNHTRALSADVTSAAALKGDRKPAPLRTRVEYKSRADSGWIQVDDETDINNIDEMELLSASTNSQNAPYVKLMFALRLRTVKMIKYNIPLQDLLPPFLLPRNRSEEIFFSPYDCFFFLVKVVLAIQLVFMSRRSHTLDWIRLGWFLEFLLWMEMLIFMFAWGLMIYFRRGGFGYIFSLNIITLIVMINMGSTANETYSTSYFMLLIFQSCRYLVFFRYLADSNLFISLVPLLMRVFFIIFCIIYSFAVIGHNRLCDVFNANNIDDNADDDATIWLNFEQMFNFNSLLQTMYTLFYVAMLGNWTFIMDAAAQTQKVPSLLYFYTFRLLMTLVVIPIMFAFIIQSYIAKRDKEEKTKGTTDEGRLSDHLRIVGTYQFEPPTPSAVGEEPISDHTIDRALQRAESKRTLSPSSQSDHDRSVTSYQMEEGGDTSSTATSSSSKIKSEKDAIRRWNQGTLSVQAMFDAYASGHLFKDKTTGAADVRDRSASEASMGSERSAGSEISRWTSSDREKYQVKQGEKSASMMTFWSGGQSGVMQKSASEKDKKRAQILERMLEETLNQIRIEQRNLERLHSEFLEINASRRK